MMRAAPLPPLRPDEDELPPLPRLEERPPEPDVREIPREIAEIDVNQVPPLRIRITPGRNPTWELN